MSDEKRDPAFTIPAPTVATKSPAGSQAPTAGEAPAQGQVPAAGFGLRPVVNRPDGPVLGLKAEPVARPDIGIAGPNPGAKQEGTMAVPNVPTPGVQVSGRPLIPGTTHEMSLGDNVKTKDQLRTIGPIRDKQNLAEEAQRHGIDVDAEGEERARQVLNPDGGDKIS